MNIKYHYGSNEDYFKAWVATQTRLYEYINAGERQKDLFELEKQELRELIADLISLVLAVEWIEGFDPNGIPAPRTYSYCPWCKGAEPDHNCTCARQSILDQFTQHVEGLDASNEAV